MESIAKSFAAAIILLTLTGCATRTVTKVIDTPKPTVDARILQLCDVQLTPISDNPSPNDLFISYGEALIKLNACACRQREARNALCSLTSPGCAVVKSCEQKGIDDDSIKQ